MENIITIYTMSLKSTIWFWRKFVMIKIKKFKYNNTKVNITFFKSYLDRYGNTKEKEYKLKSNDKPLKQLVDALQALNSYVLSSEPLQVKVTGISYSNMGVCLIVQYSLSKSNGVINRIEEYYNEHGDAGQLMSSYMAHDIKELEQLIINYVNGERVKIPD